MLFRSAARVSDQAAADACAQVMAQDWIIDEDRREWVEYVVHGLARVATLDRANLRYEAVLRHLLGGTHRVGDRVGPLIYGREVHA